MGSIRATVLGHRIAHVETLLPNIGTGKYRSTLTSSISPSTNTTRPATIPVDENDSKNMILDSHHVGKKDGTTYIMCRKTAIDPWATMFKRLDRKVNKRLTKTNTLLVKLACMRSTTVPHRYITLMDRIAIGSFVFKSSPRALATSK